MTTQHLQEVLAKRRQQRQALNPTPARPKRRTGAPRTPTIWDKKPHALPMPPEAFIERCIATNGSFLSQCVALVATTPLDEQFVYLCRQVEKQTTPLPPAIADCALSDEQKQKLYAFTLSDNLLNLVGFKESAQKATSAFVKHLGGILSTHHHVPPHRIRFTRIRHRVSTNSNADVLELDYDIYHVRDDGFTTISPYRFCGRVPACALLDNHACDEDKLAFEMMANLDYWQFLGLQVYSVK